MIQLHNIHKSFGTLEVLKGIDLTITKGEVVSNWYYKGDDVYYEFTVPTESTAYLTLPDGTEKTLSGGKYMFTVKG